MNAVRPQRTARRRHGRAARHRPRASRTALAAAGADVIGVSANLEPAGSEAQRRVESHGRAFTALRADLADPDGGARASRTG